MELKDVKTVDHLIRYFALNVDDAFYNREWKKALGIKYSDFIGNHIKHLIGDTRLTNLRTGEVIVIPSGNIVKTYHNWFMRYLRNEIEHSNYVFGVEGANAFYYANDLYEYQGKDEIKEALSFLPNEDIIPKIKHLYRIGLGVLERYKKMYEKRVSREVWDFYSGRFLEHLWDGGTKQWQLDATLNLYEDLRYMVAEFIIQDEFTEHYIWTAYTPVEVVCKEVIQEISEDFTHDTREDEPRTFHWVHNKPLDEVLDLFKPLYPLFANPSEEGFKTAFGGGRISSIQEGILKPSRNNQTAVFYLIYLLVQSNCLKEAEKMGSSMKHLLGTSAEYRKYKSQFVKEDYKLADEKEDLIDQFVKSLGT